MQQNKLPINCNIHVYDLFIPLVQFLKCAQIVQNSSKLKIKKKKNGSVKTFASFSFFSKKEGESVNALQMAVNTHYRRLCS